MKRLFPLLILILICSSVFSQDGADALRFSETFAGGSARSIAMGGAFGALGADFSAVSQNPAGLGLYRKSEISVSPQFRMNHVKSDYLETTSTDNKFTFNNNNLSIVLNHSWKKKEKGLVGWSFGFGFNKINDFNSNSIAQGVNSASSLADDFAWTANNYSSLDMYTDGLFYDAYILDYDSIGDEYYVNHDMDGPVLQQKAISKWGRMNDFLISTGFNISNIVYFGFSFNWTPVHYDESSLMSEFRPSDPSYLYFNYNEEMHIDGTGYGGKFGIIVRPVSMLRVGVAFHTPVFFNLRSSSTVYAQSYYEDGNFRTYYPWDGYNEIYVTEYDYDITTPARFIGSVALTISDKAIISSDVEFINYSNMRLHNGGDGYDFTTENQDITYIYKNAINWKTGAEVRLEPFYIRGGFGYYGSPYVNGELNEKSYSLMYCGGLGFRDKNFFVDIAYSYMTRNESLLLYPSVETDVKYTNGTSRITTTVGLRF